MNKAIIQQESFNFDFQSDFLSGVINEKNFKWDIRKIDDHHYHIIKDHVSFDIYILQINKEDKTVSLRINGKTTTVKIEDRYDVLLKEMGLENLSKVKIKELKAPMPGLVLDVKVNPGDSVEKGQPLLVLEAMKMENVLKSPADGVITDIKVKKGQAVEKNEILITF
ncbi:MAG: acetyl-CoA carboxylase biotin carboxyl carrier protein subunit [Bacteroidetes bacterium]|nr:MAG: acetyl-CoA carboxylase biotin carboxyl carrier protein subunit [Bacteroidota bacterium]